MRTLQEIQQYLRGLPQVPLDCRPEGCPGCPNKGVKVGARGPIDSPFVIVGESPGSNEMAKGLPFVGASGVMLYDTLCKVGWDPDKDPAPYITNALQCHPGKEKDPRVMSENASRCQDRLWKEILKHPRKVILCLGSAASQSITNNFGLKITAERGRPFATNLASEAAVVTVHPAFLMRPGGAHLFQKWKKDLEFAVQLLHGEARLDLWKEPLWSVVNDRSQLYALVERMKQAKEIAADIETSGLHFQRNYIGELYITSDLSRGRMVDIIPAKVIWDNTDLMSRLLGNQAKWIWHNGKFDIKFFRFEGIPEARVDEDTMLLSYVLMEYKGHDLDTVAWDTIAAPKHKHMIDKYFVGIPKAQRNYIKHIPTEERYKYGAYDTSKTLQMYYVLRDKVAADPKLDKLYTKIMIPGTELLAQIEMAGLCLNMDQVQSNLDAVSKALDDVDEEIQQYALKHIGSRINVGSWQQLGNLLYTKMGLHVKNEPSTNEKAIIQIERQYNHPIVPLIKKWRKLAKIKGTYIVPAATWVGTDGKVHCDFKLIGTTTGRLASAEPNLQNQPRDPDEGDANIPAGVSCRAQFMASAGKVIVEVDLNQAELRSLAIMSNDELLLKIYTENTVSIHHLTSVKFFGENYTKNQKMRGKAVNFGIVYGRTAPSLAEEFNISVVEAERYIEQWFELYPGAKAFIERCRKAVLSGKTITTAFGRKRRWGVVSYENVHDLQNQAANFPHQSTASDICLVSAIEVQSTLIKRWNAPIINLVHDAIYYEIDNDPIKIRDSIRYVQSVMQRVPIDWGLTRVPFLAEAKVGSIWGGGHMKDWKDPGDEVL